MAAQRDTEIRRDLRDVQADQAGLRDRQEELEDRLLAAPAARVLRRQRARGTSSSFLPPRPRLRTLAGKNSSHARWMISPGLPSEIDRPQRVSGKSHINDRFVPG